MPRRRSKSDQFFDDLQDVLRIVPWWVGPPLILFAWLLFRFILPAILTGVSPAENNSVAVPVTQMFSTMSVMLSPYIAGVIGLVWVVALFKKLGDSHRLERQTGIDSIRSLPWREFELLLAEAFRLQGYSVVDTGGIADGGIDLVLSKDGQETLVQAKQWKAWKVGVKVVRELFGVQTSRGAQAAIIVTSGRFTEEARRFALESDIVLIDGQALERMIAEVQRSGRVEPKPETKVMAIEPVTTATAPKCPTCGSPMVQRIAKRGANAGESFWGCPGFPACRGTRPMV
jgi:restriction system protein